MERGDQKEIARIAGISESYLSMILARRRQPSGLLAVRLYNASRQVLGAPIPFMDWLFNDSTSNPIFRGEPLTDIPLTIRAADEE